jgi:hypothetical protein
MSAQRAVAVIVAWFGILWLSGTVPVAAQSVNVFAAFTGHIERQIQRDKQSFHDAQICTEWFYKQQKKSGQPKAEGIAFVDCPARYPGGLKAAREDFSSTQSALSLSLTFYQFALVGDRNDDGHYNAAELRDVLESFELTYDRNRPDSIHVIVLTGTFDSIRKAGGMERLMTSMGTLYDKGYRLTQRDRNTLDKITK